MKVGVGSTTAGDGRAEARASGVTPGIWEGCVHRAAVPPQQLPDRPNPAGREVVLLEYPRAAVARAGLAPMPIANPPRARTCATRDPRPGLALSANARLTLPKGRSTRDEQGDARAGTPFPNAARESQPVGKIAHIQFSARRAPTENPKIKWGFGCEYFSAQSTD